MLKYRYALSNRYKIINKYMEERKKILIAEDEEPLRKALVEKFEGKIFKTVEAGDGVTALERALSEKPDLIILDIIMPGMGGMFMLKKLRKDDWGKNIPVIFLTNLSADDRIIQDVTETNPTYYFVKTEINLSGLYDKVKELLKV